MNIISDEGRGTLMNIISDEGRGTLIPMMLFEVENAI